jgi:hypothetical protein
MMRDGWRCEYNTSHKGDQMGFIKRSQLRRFEIKHFGVSHTIDHEEPGYDRTEVFNPGTQKNDIKYVQKFDAIEGTVINAEWYDRTDNSNKRYVGYTLTVDVDEEVITLDFPYGKPAYRVLVRHGRNVDWSKRVRFSAWKTKNKQDKDTHGFCIWQAGPDGKDLAVKSAHTVDNPNGCPPAVKDNITGDWDFRNAERWLKEQFDKVCVPKITTTGTQHQDAQPAAKAAIAAATAGHGDANDPYGEFAPPTYEPEDDDQVPF